VIVDNLDPVLLDVFSSAGVAVAGALTCIAYFLRQRRRRREGESARAQWNGAVFDARRVAPRILGLRQDYAAGSTSHPPITSKRKALLASTRRKMGRRAYFQRAAFEHADSSDLETHLQ